MTAVWAMTGIVTLLPMPFSRVWPPPPLTIGRESMLVWRKA